MPRILLVQKVDFISAGGGDDSLSGGIAQLGSAIHTPSVVVLVWGVILALATSLASWLVGLSSDVGVSAYLSVTL
jgi:hypothetical protein